MKRMTLVLAVVSLTFVFSMVAFGQPDKHAKGTTQMKKNELGSDHGWGSHHKITANAKANPTSAGKSRKSSGKGSH